MTSRPVSSRHPSRIDRLTTAARGGASSLAAVVESLEGRALFSAVLGGTSPQDLLSSGFNLVEYEGRQVYAKRGEWILRLRNSIASTPKGLDRLDRLLGKVNRGIRVAADLGGNGFVLLKAPAGLGYQQLTRGLRRVPGFAGLEPNQAAWRASVTPNDPSFAFQHHLHNTGQEGGFTDADIDGPEAWGVTKGDGSVVVGVIDTGVDYNHPDLAANVWRNPGETAGDGIDNDGNGYVDDVRGWDFTGSGDNAPLDADGHGTHVAGTVAAVGNNGVGVSGVAWNAKVMPLRIFDDNDQATTAGILGSINYAVKMRRDHGVNLRVINASWGTNYSTALEDAVAAAGQAGILFVAAAGNFGINNDLAPAWPANLNLPNVLSVAATDRRDQLPEFSNFGEVTVHLAAPGVQVYSTIPGGAYAPMDGTSAAAPQVAGAAALAWSAVPGATVTQVRDALIYGGDFVGSLVGFTASGRRLNAHGTLARLVVPGAPAAVTLTPLSPNRLTVSWTDTTTLEQGFRVERSVNGGAFTEIASVGSNVTSHQDQNVAAGNTYRYRVFAWGHAGESAPAEAEITLAPDLPPEVSQLLLSGSAWTTGFVSHLNSLGYGNGGYAINPVSPAAAGAAAPVVPWTNFNRVQVRFNEHVNVDAGDLRVYGQTVTEYGIIGFGYNPLNFTATWTLARTVPVDRLRIEIAPGGVTDATGQPLADGFSQRLGVLPGDVNRDGRVTATDLLEVRRRIGRSAASPGTGPGAYGPFHDLDGNGSITAADYNAARMRLLTALPPETALLAVMFSAQRVAPDDGSGGPSSGGESLETLAGL